jgi:hypothetical protein
VRYDPIARVVMTETGVYSASRMEYTLPQGKKLPVLGTTPDGKTVAAWIENGILKMHNVSSGVVMNFSSGDFAADQVMNYDGTIYVKNGANIYVLVFLGNIVTVQRVSGVLENATKLHDGVIIQNLLGACYTSVFNDKACYQIHLKELDGVRIIEAKYDNKVLMVLGFANGKYDKYIFRLSENYQEYDIRLEKDVGPVALNFVVLPKGVCAHLNEKEELELFSNVRGSASIKVVSDPALNGDMKLFRDGNQVLFAKGNQLYSIALK